MEHLGLAMATTLGAKSRFLHHLSIISNQTNKSLSDIEEHIGSECLSFFLIPVISDFKSSIIL
ncbi:MAG: hypothetical protein HOE00_00495 [Euryarchaeota archaeon]|nr:hypothetical protein [Euryarchaeota archaeon]MBT4649911.1 hypothetical protein [Euryarchaeota archaeon]MBT7979801.1 hypothetical protein [Euryarchaeota archaeon]